MPTFHHYFPLLSMFINHFLLRASFTQLICYTDCTHHHVFLRKPLTHSTWETKRFNLCVHVYVRSVVYVDGFFLDSNPRLLSYKGNDEANNLWLQCVVAMCTQELCIRRGRRETNSLKAGEWLMVIWWWLMMTWWWLDGGSSNRFHNFIKYF